MKKRWLSLGLVLTLAVFCAGCNGVSSIGSDETPAPSTDTIDPLNLPGIYRQDSDGLCGTQRLAFTQMKVDASEIKLTYGLLGSCHLDILYKIPENGFNGTMSLSISQASLSETCPFLNGLRIFNSVARPQSHTFKFQKRSDGKFEFILNRHSCAILIRENAL